MISVYKSEIEKDLINKVEPVLESMEYRLRDLEVIGSTNPVIRVTLDFPKTIENTKLIGVQDCEKVHRKLGPMFDLWDPFEGAYTLELSSPGESAPLRTLEDFKEALNGQLKFKTIEAIAMPEPLKARKNWAGRLMGVDDEGKIELEDDFGLHKLDLSCIRQAHWKREWTPQKKER